MVVGSAMPPDKARPVYESFLENLRTGYKPSKVQCGQFQTRMREPKAQK